MKTYGHVIHFCSYLQIYTRIRYLAKINKKSIASCYINTNKIYETIHKKKNVRIEDEWYSNSFWQYCFFLFFIISFCCFYNLLKMCHQFIASSVGLASCRACQSAHIPYAGPYWINSVANTPIWCVQFLFWGFPIETSDCTANTVRYGSWMYCTYR